MFIHVDPKNGLAIYEQVARQIKYAIASQAIRTGDLVPSVRELARELAVNPNTIAKAFRDLQVEGMLISLRGTGLAVADGALKRCKQERQELIRERLRQVFVEAQQSQLDPKQLRQIIDEELAAAERHAAR